MAVLPTKICNIVMRSTEGTIKNKVHKWTGDIELFVDDLLRAERKGVNWKQRLWDAASIQTD